MYTTENRNLILDWIRGLAIIDMMLVHYSPWFDQAGLGVLGKIIRYTDFAVEGFVLSAGFIIGSRYLGKFQMDNASVVKSLLRRVAGLIAIQYLMILTLSIPMALAVGHILTGSDTIIHFAVKSFLFLNQVPLLHILPTFIPLFLLSVPLLYALHRDWDMLICGASFLVFTWAQWHPYLPLSWIDKTIFPPLLWQIYFIGGALLGKHQRLVGRALKQYAGQNVLAACCMCAMMVSVYHGHHVSAWWTDMLLHYDFIVRKFPLNWLGLLYHGSILYVIVSVTVAAQSLLKRHDGLYLCVSSLGRNSLPVFVVHVYICFIVTYLLRNSSLAALCIIVLNILGSFWVARVLDGRATIAQIAPAVAHI